MTFLTGYMLRYNVSELTTEQWAALPEGVRDLWDWVAESRRK